MDRRRRRREKVRAGGRGSLGRGGDFRLLDLSVDGAMIEHLEPLTAGGTCLLSLPLLAVNLRLRARVAWSRVLSVAGSFSAEAQEGVRFRSGLHFVGAPDGAETLIMEFLATLRAPGPDPAHGLH